MTAHQRVIVSAVRIGSWSSVTSTRIVTSLGVPGEGSRPQSTVHSPSAIRARPSCEPPAEQHSAFGHPDQALPRLGHGVEQPSDAIDSCPETANRDQPTTTQRTLSTNASNIPHIVGVRAIVDAKFQTSTLRRSRARNARAPCDDSLEWPQPCE
jgi:hypothetical protein